MTRYAKTMSQALAEMQEAKKITKKERDKLENDNQHGELALKLAQSFGTPQEVKKIKDINKRHMQQGSIDPKDQKERDKISNKYYKMAEGLEEGYESEVLKILDDAGIDGYFKNNKLYVSKRDARDAKKALDDSDEITKLPKMVKEGTWKYAETPKEIAALKKLMSRPLPIGNTEDEKMYKDSANAKLYGLLGDDELFDALGALEDKGNPKADARKTIIKWFHQRVKDDSYGLGDETKALGKAIGLKMDYVPEEVKLDEALKGFQVDFGKGMTKGKAVYKNKKDAEEFAARRKKMGELPVKITQVTVKNANMFDDPMGPKRKRIPEEVELDEGMKYTHVAVDKKGLVIGFASDEKDAKDMARRNDGKVVKLKKPMSDKKGDMMVNRPFKEEVELDEGKMKQFHMMQDDGKSAEEIAKTLKLDLKTVKELMKESLDEKYDLYHKTFSDAMQHAYDYAKKKLGITVDPKEIDNKVATGPRKPSEGKTNKYRLKGKGGNLQIQVYNKGGSKPFELNMYKEENEMYNKLTDGNLSLKETVLQIWKEAAKDKDEGNAFGAALAAAKEKGEDTFVVAGKKYDVKTEQEVKEFVQADGTKRRVKEGDNRLKSNKNEKLVGGQKKLDKDKDGDIDGKDFAMMRKKKKTEDVEEERYRYLETKKGSLRDAVLQMWGEKKDLTKEMENGKNKKTDTGKEMTPVDMSPKMPKVKESKNKV